MDDLIDHVSGNASNIIASLEDRNLLNDLLADIHLILGLDQQEIETLPLQRECASNRELAGIVMKHNRRVPALFSVGFYREREKKLNPQFAPPSFAKSEQDTDAYTVYEPA